MLGDGNARKLPEIGDSTQSLVEILSAAETSGEYFSEERLEQLREHAELCDELGIKLRYGRQGDLKVRGCTLCRTVLQRLIGT